MANGIISQKYQEYIASVAADYPGVAPTKNNEALDQVAAIANLKNEQLFYVDSLSGDDATATGAQLRPYQTIEAALAAIVAAPTVQPYCLMLAPGGYGAAPIAWPVIADKNISVSGQGVGAGISQTITYTSLGGASEESVVFENVGVQQIDIDLAAAAAASKVAQVHFVNCGVRVNRVDATAAGGPQIVRLFTCIITGIETSGVMLITGSQYIGGPITVSAPNGTLLAEASFLAGCSSFVVDGTATMIGTLLAGSNMSGSGTLISDATSLNPLFAPASNTIANQISSDTAPFIGFVPSTPGDWAVPPTQVADALNSLGSNIQGNALVYKPGGVAAKNLYTSWADVMTAVALQNGPTTIYFDDSSTSPAQIPAGAYALPNVTFANWKAGSSTQVEVADGVSWTGLYAINDLDVSFLNTAIVESISSRSVRFNNGSTITANGTSPIWDIAASALFQLYAASSINGSGGAAAISIGAGQTLLFGMTQLSGANSTAIIGGATENLTVFYADSTPNFAAQAGFTGSLSTQLLTKAEFDGYTPNTAADWTALPGSVIPADQGNALDILAANVGGGGGITELTGDVTAGPGAGSQAATIAAGVVSNSKLADVATATFKGRVSGGVGSPEDLTTAQATALLDVMTPALKGLVPVSGGGTTTFLRADGNFAVPPGSGATSPAFVYQEGGVAAGNVYNTWAALYAAMNAVAGPRVLQIDNSVTSPCVVPAGAYNLADVTMVGRGTLTLLQLANGVTFTGFPTAIRDALRIDSVSAAAIYVQAAGDKDVILDNRSVLASSTTPFINVSSGANFQIIMNNESVLVNAGAAVLDVDAGGNGSISEYSASSVANNTYSGAGAPTVFRVGVPDRQVGTISGGQAAAKQIALGLLVEQTTVVFTIQGLSGLTYSFDYTLTDTSTETIIDWTGLALDGVIVGGEKFTVQFWS